MSKGFTLKQIQDHIRRKDFKPGLEHGYFITAFKDS
jgi:hypothetical protein